MTPLASREGGGGDVAVRRCSVLYLVGQLGFGGSEGQLRLLVKNLDRTAFEPHVLVFHPSPNADHVDELCEAGVGVSVMPRAVAGPLGKLVFAIRTARRVQAQVVHSWTAHDNPYAAWAGRLSGARLRWGSLRGSTSLPGFRSLPRWYRRYALHAVQRLVVNSCALSDELKRLGIPDKRILVLPNCVEPGPPTVQGVGRKKLEALGFDRAHRVFGSVGNIRRAKNQVLFLRALARVAAAHPEARGVIIGETLDGEEATRAELEVEIQRLGLHCRVVLAGFRADVRELMGGMAGLCMTSDSEGMPNVVLEAMASGIPVVATAVGGVPEVVHDGVTGYLVARGDEQGIADAMTRVLDAPEDAARMATAARGLVEQEWACAAMAQRLEAACKEALRAGGAP